MYKLKSFDSLNLQLSEETLLQLFPGSNPSFICGEATLYSVVNYVALGSFSWEQDSDKVKGRMSMKPI